MKNCKPGKSGTDPWDLAPGSPDPLFFGTVVAFLHLHVWNFSELMLAPRGRTALCQILDLPLGRTDFKESEHYMFFRKSPVKP